MEKTRTSNSSSRQWGSWKKTSTRPSLIHIGMQIFPDSAAHTASKFDKGRERRRYGKEHDVGNAHENIYSMKRTDLLESNTRIIYAIDWGQCSPMMGSKLESLDHFNTKSTVCDCAWSSYRRYKASPTISKGSEMFSYRRVTYGAATMNTAKGTAKHCPGHCGHWLDPAAEYRKKSVAVAKKTFVAIGFLKRANRKRNGGLWSELENSYTRGQNHYPTGLTGAYNLVLNYKPTPFTNRDGAKDTPTRMPRSVAFFSAERSARAWKRSGHTQSDQVLQL
jgi:hypothetical protein